MLHFIFAALPKCFKEIYHYFTAEIYRRTKGKIISVTGALLYIIQARLLVALKKVMLPKGLSDYSLMFLQLILKQSIINQTWILEDFMSL